MCFVLAQQIRDSKIVSGSKMDVLLALADFASVQNDYQAWPSIQTIADRIGKTRRTVDRALSHLVKLDLIVACATTDRGVKIYKVRHPNDAGATYNKDRCDTNSVAIPENDARQDRKRGDVAPDTSKCRSAHDKMSYKPINNPINEPKEKNNFVIPKETDFGHTRPEGFSKDEHVQFLIDFGFISKEDIAVAVKLAGLQDAVKPEKSAPEPENFELELTSPEGEKIPDLADKALEDFRAAAKKFNLPNIRDFGPDRRKKLTILLQDIGGLSVWREGLEMIADAPFLRGQNDRKWRARFDWIAKKENFIKILEGECANWGKAPEKQPERQKNDSTGKTEFEQMQARMLARAQARDDAKRAQQQGSDAPDWGGFSSMDAAPILELDRSEYG